MDTAGKSKRALAQAKKELEKYLSSSSLMLEFESMINLLKTADYAQRMKIAGKISGIMRRCKSHARAHLTAHLIEALSITPTQTVAKNTMVEVFGTAISIGDLCELFAKEGRDATVKMANEARQKLAENPEAVRECGEIYEAAIKKLKDRIEGLKKAAK